jgi:hypothetical protein
MLAAIAGGILSGCSNKPQPSPPSVAPTIPPKITQFYATAPRLAPGEKELLCYGVEGASSVHLDPPPQELSAAMARCVEVNPKETTTYKLTAEGAGGPAATQQLTVAMGAPRVHIVNIDVSALTVTDNKPVSICYKVQHATEVEIEPGHFRGGSKPEGCTLVQPKSTTAYTITAVGADGDRDQEHVTIKASEPRHNP